MSSNLRDPRALGWLLYLLALLLIVGPLSEWIVITWPLNPGSAGWRFATIGLLGDRLTMPVVGLFTAIVAATLLEHRTAQGILAGLGLLAAPGLAGLAMMISLEGLELRATVREDVLSGFDRSLARTTLLLLYAAVVVAVLGWAALKARGKHRSRRSESGPLMTRGPLAQKPGA